MRTWDGECSIPQIMCAFNFLVTVQKLQHTCTFFPHHFLLLNLKLEQLCNESEREREACCHANVTRKQRRSDEMRLINSDSYNWIVEYFTVQMTSDEGDCHIFLKIDSTCCCSAHFLFLPRQLSLFWHISDSCHRFNCIRRWQVYSLRGGVWCPQVNVPRRGHVGTI